VDNVLEPPLTEATDSYLKTYLSDRLTTEVQKVDEPTHTLDLTRQELNEAN